MRRVADRWLTEILLAMQERPTLTRAEILQRTRLNPASASHALQALLRGGTVLKVGALESNGGRSPDLLRLNPDAAYFVAVDLESIPPRVALCNLAGEIRSRHPIPLAKPGTLRVEEVLRAIEQVAHGSSDPWCSERILAAGIGCVGLIDAQGQVSAVNLGWKEVPMEGLLQQATLPVFVDTYGRLSVQVERTYGAARGCENFLLVVLGSGVGLGIFADGRYLGGRDGMAGEFGHVVVDPLAEDRCRCGNRGCLEAIASGPSIVRQFCQKARLPKKSAAAIGVEHVFHAARSGNSAALEVIDRVGASIGLGLSSLIQLFNPELIVIRGSVAGGLDLLRPRFLRQIENHALPRLARDVRIVPTEVGPDILLRGAADLAFQRCVSDPALLRRLCAPLGQRHRPVGPESAMAKSSTAEIPLHPLPR